MRESRMLGRHVKTDVTDIDARPKGHAERLDGSIQVLVIKRVFIMPDSSRRAGHFVADEPNAIVAWIRLDPVSRCARPSHYRWLHSHRVTNWGKKEIRRTATDRKLLIGEIVKHVALTRMRLAPGVFMGADVCRFAIISRAGVLGWDQVSHVNQDPVRHTVVVVAGVIIGGRWERSRERIDPRPRTNALLVAIQT